MKLHLLHGLGIISSRAKLQSIKKQFDANNVMVFGPESSTQQIMGSLLTPSLFSQDRLIILENPPEDFELDLSLITLDHRIASSAYNLSLILWFDHLVDTKKWPGFEYFLFPESKETSVFPFLDCLGNKDKKAFMERQKLEVAGFDVFYFLNMVFYLLRSLAVTPKNAPEFVKRKLIKQRSNFSPEDVRKFYKEILKIEFKLKSGLMGGSQAQFLIINQFIGN